MKRFVIVVVMAVAAALMLPATSSAQLNLSRLLGGSQQQSTTATQSNDPYKRLAASAPAASTLNGEWLYSAASFSYLGSNALADIAIAQLNPAIADLLRHASITSGSAHLTLDNGKGCVSHNGYKMEGTYTYTRSTAGVSLSTTLDGKTYSVGGYVRYSSDTLTVLLDARQLLKTMISVMPELRQDQNIVLIDTLIRDLGDVFVVCKFHRK